MPHITPFVFSVYWILIVHLFLLLLLYEHLTYNSFSSKPLKNLHFLHSSIGTLRLIICTVSALFGPWTFGQINIYFGITGILFIFIAITYLQVNGIFSFISSHGSFFHGLGPIVLAHLAICQTPSSKDSLSL